MMTMYFMHGLFLTCTQKSRLYLHDIALIENPCFTYFDGQLSACDDKFPFTLAPCMVTTAPSLGFYPFHPFLTPQFTLHYIHRRHQQSRPSLSRTKTFNGAFLGIFLGGQDLF